MKNYNILFLSLCSFIWIACNGTSSSSANQEYSSPVEDEWVEVKEEVEEDCTECDGLGFKYVDCSECGGWGQKVHYVSGTQPKACEDCYGFGKVKCERCDGVGYTRCEYCNGNGRYKCTVCNGYGMIIIDANRPSTWIECSRCGKSGYEKCFLCEGTGKNRCCGTGMVNCPTCWGSGTHGQKEYSYTENIECSSCNGSGRTRLYCDNCYGTGKVKEEKIVKKLKSEL